MRSKGKRRFAIFIILGINVALYSVTSACDNRTGSTNPQVSFQQGVAKLQRNDYAGAIDLLNQAIELNPNYTEAYINRGIAYDESGNLEQAIKDYSQAIRISPSVAEAYYNRANTFNRLNKLEQAIQDYNLAIKLNPKYAYAYANRAMTYFKMGNKQKAIEDLEEAKELFRGDQSNRDRIQKQIEKIQNN